MLLAGLLLALTAPAWGVPGQAAALDPVAASPPAGVRIDGHPGEWQDRPPQLLLTAGSAAFRPGRVWLAESAEGLIIAGDTGGGAPQFAAAVAGLADADHLRIAVANVDGVPLPPLGWSNPQGAIALAGADDCARLDDFAGDPHAVAECRDWVARQSAYREELRRLFVRDWRLAPGLVAETLAVPAFERLPAAARETLAPLAPAGQPVARFAALAGTGYGFEVLIPWEALPPSPTLEVARLRLLIEARAATMRPAADGPSAPPAAPAVRLDPPRRWRIAACGYPLTADDAWEQQRLPAYFMPRPGPEITDVFVIENPAAGGGVPDLEALSPVVRPLRFFSREIAPGLVVCGPPLSVSRAGATAAMPSLRLRPGFRVVTVADGWLIADGPVTGFAGRVGSGACGGCPLISLSVLFLPRSALPPVLAFADTWPIAEDGADPDGGRDARILVDPDLATITVWEGEAGPPPAAIAWTRVRHCYEAATHRYKECGRTADSPPPAGLARPPDDPDT